jgi:hypothetical protein
VADVAIVVAEEEEEKRIEAEAGKVNSPNNPDPQTANKRPKAGSEASTVKDKRPSAPDVKEKPPSAAAKRSGAKKKGKR